MKYKVMLIGGSAGSLEILLKIVAALPERTNLFYVIVVHRRSSNDSILADLLSGRSSKLVKEVEDKDVIVTDTIYIAPSDYHLLLEDQSMFSLDTSEKIHFSRPSIDVTFESAAEVFGAACIAILLSGANADGAAGLEAIKKAGGYVIVQDPESSEVGFMPQQALNRITVDQIIERDNVSKVIRELLESNS